MAEASRATGKPEVRRTGVLPEAGKQNLPEAGKLNVFFSYSRDDIGFADQLDIALGAFGFATTLDRHGISGGEDWRNRLGNLIRDADTVAFVLSPASARSEICAWEVDEATRLGKRILPVLCRPLEGAAPPPQLTDLNYIFFYPEPKSPGSGFGAGLVRLVEALNTDLDWLREHTRLMQRASEWETGGKPANRLLSGTDIVEAKAWAARRPKAAPAPTPLHLDFIRASEVEEGPRQNAERRRLEELAETVAARESAVKSAQQAQADKAAAQQREAEQARRVVRRTRAGLAAALVLAGMAGWFGFYARQQREEADGQRQEALLQSVKALEAQQDAFKTRDAALLTQSQYLADAARQATELEKDPATGLLLALEALPDKTGDSLTVRNCPYWHLAEVSLSGARRLLRGQRVLHGHTREVWSVAVTPDGLRVITGAWDNTARVWDATSGDTLLVLKGHSDLVRSIPVTPDGQRIVTGSLDHSARIWDAATGAELLVLKWHDGATRSVTVTPDGKRILTGSLDKTIRQWDLETGRALATLTGHEGRITSVIVSRDGTRLVSGGEDSTARVWDAGSGAELAVLKGHTNSVWSVALSPDGARIITASEDGTSRIWDARTAAETQAFKGHSLSVWSVAVLGGGRQIVTVSDDRTVRIWDLGSGREVGRLKGHTEAVLAVAVSSDGSSIVTGSADNTARLWNAKTGAEMRVFEGHTKPVWAVAITPDGARIVTGSDDRTARIWDARTGTEVAHLKGHTGQVWTAAVTPDGAHIVTSSDDRTARLWAVLSTGQDLIEEAKRLAPRRLTAAQRAFYHLATAPPGWCATLKKWP